LINYIYILFNYVLKNINKIINILYKEFFKN
jgi:hypothetical protein